MRRTMIRRLSWIVLAACGGAPSGSGPRAPHAEAPHLEPHVAEQTWYRATSICGQGPFEVQLPTTGARWGEDVELLVHAPRAITLHAEVLADGAQVSQTTFGSAPANSRCVADMKERLAMAHTGGGTASGGGTPVETGTTVVTPPLTAPPSLSIEPNPAPTSDEIIRFHLPDRATPHITIRFWSVEPNDLEGVLFGAAHVIWRPTIPDVQYEAYIVDQQREAQARAEREAAEWARTHPPRPEDPHAEEIRLREAEQARLRAEQDRLRAEQEEQRRRLAAALEEQRRQQRAAFCAAHADDRDCWGAGGLRVHLDLERHQHERDEYCGAHPEDARCWTDADWSRRRTAWNARLTAAASTCQPTGAPPAALAETQPPALSLHATWRPGYYQWTECTWVWLAGQWRVPDSDLAANTTQAPAAPPPPQIETAPSRPVATAVWIPGFWQWSGSTWVWIGGSWQLRPSQTVEWRPAEWQARGSVHVLVPGGWIHVR
jgi:hypothetical protein